MPRAKAILQSEFPYNLTARCINKEWFHLPMPEVWDIFSEQLYLTTCIFNLKIHSFVLMSNHFHLIATTPDSNVSQCMQFFMKNVSLRLTRAGNRINESFAGRHYKTILHSNNYYLNAYKYNYQNPILAGIVNRAEDYPFSTLNGLLGFSKMLIPVVEDRTLFPFVEDTLEWINRPAPPERLEAVRWALKRPHFKSKRCKNSRRFILGKNDLL